MKVMKNEAQVIPKRMYTAIRRLDFTEAIRIMVTQIDDLTVASATT
jgi:hypothetical protein